MYILEATFLCLNEQHEWLTVHLERPGFHSRPEGRLSQLKISEVFIIPSTIAVFNRGF